MRRPLRERLAQLFSNDLLVTPVQLQNLLSNSEWMKAQFVMNVVRLRIGRPDGPTKPQRH